MQFLAAAAAGQQQLAGLRRLVSQTAAAACRQCCTASSLQRRLQQHQFASRSVAPGAQPIQSLLLSPAADVSRFHTARHVAARSSSAASSDSTDSIAAVRRLVSGRNLAAAAATCTPLLSPAASLAHLADAPSAACAALQLDAAADRLSQALQLADVAGTKARLAALQNDASRDDIWDDPATAQKLVTEISGLKEELAQVEK